MSFHWRPDLWNSHQRCKKADHQDLYPNHPRDHQDYDHRMVFNDNVLITIIRCAQMWQKPSAAQFQKPSKSTPLKTSWCHFISSCKDRLIIVTMMNKTLIVLTRVNYQRISGRRKVAQRWTSRSAHRTTRTCAGITKLRSAFKKNFIGICDCDRFSELTNSQVDECETVYDEECKKVPFHQCKTVKVPLSCWASHSWTVSRWL